MPDFIALQTALEGRFHRRLERLPKRLRTRVQHDVPLLASVWNQIGPERRREGARQSDMQHDPSIRRQNARAWKLANEIIELEGTATPTAGDWMAKKAGLADIQRASDENDAEAERILADARSKAASEAWKRRLFEEVFWPPKRAIAWIRFRNQEINEENLRSESRYWKHLLSDARGVIKRALQTGRIAAIKDGGELRREFWATADGQKWLAASRFAARTCWHCGPPARRP